MCERVHVGIRFRPLNAQEVDQCGREECARVMPEESEVRIGDKTCTYDHVFPTTSSQEEIYDTVGHPIVQSVLKGFNGTVLAYGQTGSGKTHTMTGPGGGKPESLVIGTKDYQQRGLTLRVIEALFGELRKLPKIEVSFTVVVTIVELYKETLKDLLSAGGPTPSELRVREDRLSGRGVFVEGLTEVTVDDLSEAVAAIKRGLDKRNVAATMANDTSSRSHTIVTLWVTQVDHVHEDAQTIARLNLVDLAGSERVEKTGAEGDRLKEAQTINLSLSLLGNVIHKLTDGKSIHIPYRDSKLTRLLQDSFGGNSRTTLFCNCSTSVAQHSETLSTLMFANRAKQIKNKPRANKVLSGQELQMAYQRSQEEIAALKARIASLEESVGVATRGTLRPNSQKNLLSQSARNSLALEGENLTTAVTEEAGTDLLQAWEAAKRELVESSETLRSVLKELTETKDELEDRSREVGEAAERVSFYEKRESAAQLKANDWKGKMERERMAADSWMRKYNDLLKEHQKAAEPAKPKKPKPKLKRTPSVPRRSSSSNGNSRRGSVGGGKGPSQPASAAASPSVSEALAGGDDEEAEQDSTKELQDAQRSEADALTRERQAQQALDDALRELEQARGVQTDAETKVKSLQTAQVAWEAAAEKKESEYEEKIKQQDKEIGNLLAKLEKATTVKRPSGNDAFDRLQMENSLLYEQNNENAQRIVEITRSKDTIQKELKAARDEQARLHHQIELANISAELKGRLLGDKLKASRAAFHHRLLMCFGDET
ncbi:Kinesin-related protein 3 [Diplonema papillatum]|nr:Kinesin-related protein 3 [Diplonema papillatum]